MIYACKSKYAQAPYYVEELGIHLYTLEELCYYLHDNIMSLDESVMKPELCLFVEQQLGLPTLGRQLADLIRAHGSLAMFIVLILEECAYCTKEEIRSVERLLKEQATMDIGGRKKTRGDYFLNNGKYLYAVREYEQALDHLDAETDALLYSSVCHNLGVVYARMFQGETAAEWFKKAYDISEDPDSYTGFLAALRLCGSREQYVNKVLDMNLNQEAVAALEEKIASYAMESRSDDEYRRIQRAIQLREDGDFSGFYRGLSEILNRWKKEYRKNMECD